MLHRVWRVRYLPLASTSAGLAQRLSPRSFNRASSRANRFSTWNRTKTGYFTRKQSTFLDKKRKALDGYIRLTHFPCQIVSVTVFFFFPLNLKSSPQADRNSFQFCWANPMQSRRSEFQRCQYARSAHLCHDDKYSSQNVGSCIQTCTPQRS